MWGLTKRQPFPQPLEMLNAAHVFSSPTYKGLSTLNELSTRSLIWSLQECCKRTHGAFVHEEKSWDLWRPNGDYSPCPRCLWFPPSEKSFYPWSLSCFCPPPTTWPSHLAYILWFIKHFHRYLCTGTHCFHISVILKRHHLVFFRLKTKCPMKEGVAERQ